MANISITGADELIATLQKANVFDEDMQQELLYAAGDIIVEELQNAVRASGFRTEAYASSVKYYGRAKEHGQITGTYFWTKGVRNAQKRVNAELEKILTQKLKERGLL